MDAIHGMSLTWQLGPHHHHQSDYEIAKPLMKVITPFDSAQPASLTAGNFSGPHRAPALKVALNLSRPCCQKILLEIWGSHMETHCCVLVGCRECYEIVLVLVCYGWS